MLRFPQSAETLTIGKFCQIADGVVFAAASANHRHDGFSTFPFAVFDGVFEEHLPSLPAPGEDTTLGNDIWIGRDACILPGAQLGDGVIVGAGAVVAGQVAPYSVVAGNPACVIRHRFSPAIIERLQAVAWWNWPTERILAHDAAICGADIARFEAAAQG